MGSGKFPRHSRCLNGICRKCRVSIRYKKEPICNNCAIWGRK